MEGDLRFPSNPTRGIETLGVKQWIRDAQCCRYPHLLMELIQRYLDTALSKPLKCNYQQVYDAIANYYTWTYRFICYHT